MIRKIIAFLISFCFLFEQCGFAQVANVFDLSGALSSVSSIDKFRPLQLRSIAYDRSHNGFDLLLDKGDLRNIKPGQAQDEAEKLMEYFRIGVSLPNSMFWVNLRPDGQEDIIDPELAKTDLGKVLLQADLELKKDMAKATSPQTTEGRKYWKKLYEKAESIFGSQKIDIPTLTRPWIVPGEIIVRQDSDSAYVYKATLKVMLEQDYLKNSATYGFDDPRLKELNEYSSELIRQLIIPPLTKKVNSARTYANLRQVYYSLVLAQWFKQNFKGSQSGYASGINKKDLSGLTSRSAWSKETYFKAYQKSFAEGEYNTQETVSGLKGVTIRRYFSGGITPMLPEGMNVPDGGIRPSGKFSRPDKLVELEFSLGGIAVVPDTKTVLEGVIERYKKLPKTYALVLTDHEIDAVFNAILNKEPGAGVLLEQIGARKLSKDTNDRFNKKFMPIFNREFEEFKMDSPASLDGGEVAAQGLKNLADPRVERTDALKYFIILSRLGDPNRSEVVTNARQTLKSALDKQEKKIGLDQNELKILEAARDFYLKITAAADKFELNGEKVDGKNVSKLVFLGGVQDFVTVTSALDQTFGLTDAQKAKKTLIGLLPKSAAKQNTSEKSLNAQVIKYLTTIRGIDQLLKMPGIGQEPVNAADGGMVDLTVAQRAEILAAAYRVIWGGSVNRTLEKDWTDGELRELARILNAYPLDSLTNRIVQYVLGINRGNNAHQAVRMIEQIIIDRARGYEKGMELTAKIINGMFIINSLNKQIFEASGTKFIETDNNPLKEDLRRQSEEAKHVVFWAADDLRAMPYAKNAPALTYGQLNGLGDDDIVVSRQAKKTHWYLAITKAEALRQFSSFDKEVDMRKVFNEYDFFSVRNLRKDLEDKTRADGGKVRVEALRYLMNSDLMMREFIAKYFGGLKGNYARYGIFDHLFSGAIDKLGGNDQFVDTKDLNNPAERDIVEKAVRYLLDKNIQTVTDGMPSDLNDAQLLSHARDNIEKYLLDQYNAKKISDEIYKDALANTYKNMKSWSTDPSIENLSPETKEAILQAIRDQRWKDIIEVFRQEITFGTAGIRGKAALTEDELNLLNVDGPKAKILKGPNTINDIVLLRYTTGVARYARENGLHKVAIGYDSRIGGEKFAEMIAQCFIGQSSPDYQFTVYLFDEASPFPELSFAVTTKEVGADLGILVSASHNPAEYNGYKITDETGSQLPQAKKGKVVEAIDKTTTADIKLKKLEEAAEGELIWLGNSKPIAGKDYKNVDVSNPAYFIDMHTLHVNQVKKFILDKGIVERQKNNIKIGFSAFNGAGYKAVPRLLNELGFENFKTIAKLQELNGLFPAFGRGEQPDPGDPISADIAVREFIAEHGQKAFDELDILFGTDPDADRMGLIIKVPERLQQLFGKYRLLSANDVWTLLIWYRLKKKQELGLLQEPEKHYITFSHVTTDALEATAGLFGVRSLGEMHDKNGVKETGDYLNGRRSWVGFTYIADFANKMRVKGMINEAGAEESNGFSILGGSVNEGDVLADDGHVNDKDGTLAGILAVEVAAYAKENNTTIFELLDDIYRQTGHYATANKPLPRVGSFEGAEGITEKINLLKKAQKWMKSVGDGEPLVLGGRKVIGAVEFKSGRYDKQHYPGFPDEGIRFFFQDPDLKPGYDFFQSRNFITIRPSGTSQTIRFYTQIYSSPENLTDKNKYNNYSEAEKIALSAQKELLSAVGLTKYIPMVDEQLSKMDGGATIEEQAGRIARVLGVTDVKARDAIVGSMNKNMLLNDFSESVGIKKDKALELMISAGMALRAGDGYSLIPDFYSYTKLDQLVKSLVAASSNPKMVDLSVIRLERIIFNSVYADKFVSALSGFNPPFLVAQRLGQANIFPLVVDFWKQNHFLKLASSEKVLLTADKIINDSALRYYRRNGVNADFSLPFGVSVDGAGLRYLVEYQKAVMFDMARGQFNYRGTGTKETVKQFFDGYFMPVWYGKIREFVAQEFNGGRSLKAIVSNGIGANDQFMWSLVEMYNLNKPADAPVWHHIVTARDLVKLQGLDPDKTLCIDISRSGSTWEGVEAAIRMVNMGFTKRITLANGGELVDIAKAPGVSSLVVDMNPAIGGRNMPRKTTIYYTAQTVVGMFLPQMDSRVFAGLNHEFDAANDFADMNSMALAAGRFLHAAMKLQDREHVAFITNSRQLKLIGSEWGQYVMEGCNKEDIISLAMHDLKEPEYVLRNLAQSPAGKITIGMAILDKAQPTYNSDLARVSELKAVMPVMLFTIDTSDKAYNPDGLKGISQKQQAAFDILWTDLVTVFTSLLRVDANSNPNVKDVREMTAEYVKGWKGTGERYSSDALGRGEAALLLSAGEPQDPKIGVTEKQESVTGIDDARELGRKAAADLKAKGLAGGRNRLNIFASSDATALFADELRNQTYAHELAKTLGWIIDTGTYPLRAHKGHEATLAYSTDPARPLLANKSIDIFLNVRKLGPEAFYDTSFKTIIKAHEDVNGANIHQTNDSMTFPNIQKAAQVSPTILLEFQEMNSDIGRVISAFYAAFLDELAASKRADNIKDDGYFGKLLEQLKADNTPQSQRIDAARVLADRGYRPAIRPMISTLRDVAGPQNKLQIANSLVKFGPAAIDDLEAAVKSENNTMVKDILKDVLRRIKSKDISSKRPADKADGGLNIDPVLVEEMVAKNLEMFNKSPEWMRLFGQAKEYDWKSLQGVCTSRGEIEILSGYMQEEHAWKAGFIYYSGNVGIKPNYNHEIIGNYFMIKQVLEKTFRALDERLAAVPAAQEANKGGADKADGGISEYDPAELEQHITWLGSELKENDVNRRLDAARELSELFFKEGGRARVSVELLMISALNDQADAVRFIAIDTLGKGKSGSAVIPLVRFVIRSMSQEADTRTRMDAVMALGMIGDNKAVPALVRVLKEDPQVELKAYAAYSLSEIGSEVSRQPLLEVQYDQATPEFLRQAIEGALINLGKHDGMNNLDGGSSITLEEFDALANSDDARLERARIFTQKLVDIYLDPGTLLSANELREGLKRANDRFQHYGEINSRYVSDWDWFYVSAAIAFVRNEETGGMRQDGGSSIALEEFDALANSSDTRLGEFRAFIQKILGFELEPVNLNVNLLREGLKRANDLFQHYGEINSRYVSDEDWFYAVMAIEFLRAEKAGAARQDGGMGIYSTSGMKKNLEDIGSYDYKKARDIAMILAKRIGQGELSAYFAGRLTVIGDVFVDGPIAIGYKETPSDAITILSVSSTEQRQKGVRVNNLSPIQIKINKLNNDIVLVGIDKQVVVPSGLPVSKADGGKMPTDERFNPWDTEGKVQREDIDKYSRSVRESSSSSSGEVNTGDNVFDGGVKDANEVGGIDFRGMPIVSQPAIGTVRIPVMPNLIGAVALEELDKQWMGIRTSMAQGEMPYLKIKEYVACCNARPDSSKQIQAVTNCVADILKAEEEDALPTCGQLKEILVQLG